MLDELLSVLPPIRADLTAKLTGVNGFTGHGEVEFISRRNGVRSLEVELRGVAGREALVYADDQPAAKLTFDDGRANQLFITNKGDDVPKLYYGATIEIRQNGQAILQGMLKRA